MGALEFLRPGTAGWEAAWRELESHAWNAGLRSPRTAPCPYSGEVWQYMGPNQRTGGHEFRHRSHPTAGKRVMIVVFLPMGGDS